MQNIRKIIPLTLAVVCSLIFVSACGKKSSSGGGSSGSSSDKAGQEAIGFFNNLLEFRKLAFEPLKKIVDTSKKSASWVERDRVTTEKPSWNMVLIGINPYEKIAKSNLAAPKSFSSKDQEFFNSRIKLAKEGCAELNTIVATLTSYYKAEDYKDDKHKKFLDAQPRIDALVEQVAKACNEALQSADVIATAAERKVLEKRPDGVFILAMRDIMEKCREQMNILTDDRLLRVGSGTSYTDASKAEAAAKVADLADAAEALTAEIKALAEKSKALKRSAIEKNQSKVRDYDSFFTKLDAEQDVVRKTIRRIREWGNVGNEGDMRNLRSNLRGMTDSHNSFIKK